MRVLFCLSIFLFLSGCDTADTPPEPVHYSEVDIRPAPDGGFEALAASVRYPELARRAGLEGFVYIHFVVERDGSVVQTRRSDTIRGPVCHEDIGGQTCEASLIPTRAAMFTPGYLEGDEVIVQECVRFEFRLPEGPGSSPPAEDITASPCP